MGCAVNGPGEARMADLGVACGKGMGLIFKRGRIVARLPEDQLLERLMKEVDVVVSEKQAEPGWQALAASGAPAGSGGENAKD